MNCFTTPESELRCLLLKPEVEEIKEMKGVFYRSASILSSLGLTDEKAENQKGRGTNKVHPSAGLGWLRAGKTQAGQPQGQVSAMWGHVLWTPRSSGEQ